MASGSEPIIEVKLTDHPVEHTEWTTCGGQAGAECVFLGRTRHETHADHGGLVRLSYQAYRPMAERVLRQLAEEAVDRFGCRAVRIHHAVGEVNVGQASVLVGVLCSHRPQAFEACRFLIDRLKAEAPIWKREVWSLGSTWSAPEPVVREGQR